MWRELPLTSKPVAETTGNDHNEIEFCLNNNLDSTTEHIQNLSLILHGKETETNKFPRIICSYIAETRPLRQSMEKNLAKTLHYIIHRKMGQPDELCYQKQVVNRKHPSLSQNENIQQERSKSITMREDR